ncbi:MAG: hypothetical protein KGQ93_15120 [Cyanobacteria bacterium REEB459]|nr:hypothetical protein [Cyanobacteria bacterium REEB459]
MPPFGWLKRLLPVVLGLTLLVNGCSSAPSRYDQVQKDTTGFGSSAAVARKAEKGGTFNQFFPAEEGSYKVIPYQEKKGFAEYKLQRGDQTLAMLTITDTISLPSAAAKYADATQKIGGYPTVEQGTTATGLLVNGRYQVKVLSRDPSFTQQDRTTWLQKFDLKGLARLKVAIAKTKAARVLAPTPQASTPAVPATPLPATS